MLVRVETITGDNTISS